MRRPLAWQALAFVDACASVARTTVLSLSHHGRSDGSTTKVHSTSVRDRAVRSTSSGMLDVSSSPDTTRAAVMAAVRSFAEVPTVDPVLAANYAAASSHDRTRVLLDGIAHAIANECSDIDDTGDVAATQELACLLGTVLDTLDAFGGPLEMTT